MRRLSKSSVSPFVPGLIGVLGTDWRGSGGWALSCHNWNWGPPLRNWIGSTGYCNAKKHEKPKDGLPNAGARLPTWQGVGTWVA